MCARFSLIIEWVLLVTLPLWAADPESLSLIWILVESCVVTKCSKGFFRLLNSAKNRISGEILNPCQVFFFYINSNKVDYKKEAQQAGNQQSKMPLCVMLKNCVLHLT